MALTPTKRARGSNARIIGAFETTPGAVPATNGGWFSLPIVSHSLGEERPLIESDLLGQGREMSDPTPDVATNDGDIVVPVDARNFGRWLRLFFGDPTTTGNAEDRYTHTFTSGAQVLPSMSIEVGSPEVPAFSVNRGARGNQLRIAMSRSGLLNATCSLICIGETDAAPATAGPASPAALETARFPQATGYVNKGGQALGSVVGADLTFSNNLEKVETIQADGRIEDSDPGMAQSSGSITVRFADLGLLNSATGSEPVDLSFGWTFGEFALVFTVPRVFLPKPKRPITGPAGIQAEFAWQAARGAAGFSMRAALTTDVASY
jgi:hypothetical protein